MADWNPIFRGDFRYTKPFNIFAFVRNAVINRHESWDFFLAADRGAGKSASAMSLAMMIDPSFTVDHWAFTADRFIDLITSNHPHGTCIVFDDVGTSDGSSSRKWQKEEAHNLADVMQVNRTDGIITIGTSLQMSRMEVRLRAGFRVICQPIRKLSTQQTGGNGMAIDCEMRIREVDVFEDSARHKLFRYAPGGRIKFVRLFHPPAQIWREYQITRKEFLESIKAKRAEKEAAAAEKREKADDNAAKKALKATDKEWAKEVHVYPTDFKLYKNIFKRIDSAPGGEMGKIGLTEIMSKTANIQETTCNSRLIKFVNVGIIEKHRVIGDNGKMKKEVMYSLTNRGRDMINNLPIANSEA